MSEPQRPDPWRAARELHAEAAQARARNPRLAERLAREQRRLGGEGDDVGALLDEVDRRAIVDVDAPVTSSRPVVPQVKLALRKANAFLARHLAQQVMVLTQTLAAAVRRLDERVRSLEQALALDPNVVPPAGHAAHFADDLAVLEAEAGGIRRDVTSAQELTSLPQGEAALVVLDSLLDPLGAATTRTALLRALEGVRAGGTVAVAGCDPEHWPQLAGPVVVDLAPGRPWHEATYRHVAEEGGATHVATHRRNGSQLVVLRR